VEPDALTVAPEALPEGVQLFGEVPVQLVVRPSGLQAREQLASFRLSLEVVQETSL
jgi:hypothetical protein